LGIERPTETFSDAQRRAAVLGLVGATLFWGATFFLMKAGSVAIARHLPPGTGGWAETVFLMLRFTVASIFFPLVFPAARRGGLEAVKWGLLTSFPFTGGFLLQIYGLAHVDPSISALLTSMFVVFTPFLMFVLFRKSPGVNVAVGIAFAVGGLWLITGAKGSHFGIGEWLSLACAFVFSIHIVLTDVATRRAEPVAVAWHTVTFAAIECAIPLAFVRPSPFPAIPAAMRESSVLTGIGVTALLATVGAIALMNHFQRRVSPNRAAVAYTLEPVFAGIFSWIFFGEGFGARKLIGGALVVAGNLACGLRGEKKEVTPGKAEDPP
jgi:drug/metabolite transporter (DMT)-like permease